MCLISEKIKFCTCATDKVERLKHYWVLHRFDGEKQFNILGSCLPPASYRDPHFEFNRMTLAMRLNDKDAFDKPMEFKPKDQLEVSINSDSKDYIENLTYYFIYENGKWEYKDTSPFEIMNDYVDEDSGKIKSTLRR